ncbi:hypothetical protein MHTCC0001_21880 [Flavobacteriaceae bacterium MHTCC 0001]
MLNHQSIQDFNGYALDKVYFYIESDFWSKPKMNDLHKWLSNFKSLEEKYCAFKLLDRFIYYSEDDIVHLMKYGINEKIVKRYVLQIEQEHDFQLSNQEINILKKDFLKELYFIKLDTQNPSQSSEAMLRHLKIDVGFPESNILDTNDLKSDTLCNCKNLVILDDFIGSGTQIKNFWNFGKIKLDGEEIFLKDLNLAFPNISIEYFCLVCTQEGHDNFKLDDSMGIRTDLRITYGEILSNRFKIFSKESMYFEKSEIEECKNILQNLCINNGFGLLGYESLDYAIAFHHGIPDCSLPLFFTNSGKWNYLFRNKNTEFNV